MTIIPQRDALGGGPGTAAGRPLTPGSGWRRWGRRVGAGALLVLAEALGWGALPASPLVPITDERGAASVIVHPGDDRLAAYVAGRLADYLAEHTSIRVPVVTEQALSVASSPGTVIIIDGTPEQRLARRWGRSTCFSSPHPEAYRLWVEPGAGPAGRSTVLLAGQSSAGAKFAAYRFMREMAIAGRTAAVRPMDVSAAPFLATRSIALFNVWGMPIELTRRHNLEAWPVDRLERYLEMYDTFGFNAIESHDRFNDEYLRPLFGLERAEWRRKVQRMCDVAHAHGQQFFLRIWGHVVMNTPKNATPPPPGAAVPKKLAYLCVNEAEGRRRWEEEILRYYTTHYAGRIDQLIGHWCDPGVCRRQGCDFRTPLRLQMELHRAFRAIDPHFTSTFSLWFFDVTKNNPAGWARGGWAGYESDFDLIRAGLLDRDVVIATATTQPGSYREDVVQAILAAGHRPALWTWYRADHEIRPSLHIHLHERLEQYFRELPASARQLAWHNVERNVHGAANTANYYVAGRLMWDPTLSADDLLREFLALILGPDNAERVLPAYQAIERIRCQACFKNWESSRHTGAGTGDARADWALAEGALARLAEAQLPPGWRPRLPLDVAPEQLMLDLQTSLVVIRDFARCRAETMPAIERDLRAGAAGAAASALDQLEARFGAWNESLAGRQEWAVLADWIRTQRQILRAAAR